jgi:hypothetical protein
VAGFTVVVGLAFPKFSASPVSAAHSPFWAKFMMSQSMTLLVFVSCQLRAARRTMRAAGLLLVYSLSFVAASR